ncbi:MAG TPA: 2-iminoacetate synthase ThiH [Syntrophales bacterium]|nr:2-iminoacetate synthase ThiH [Syntrophales bacterium]HOL59218.1 2-iminoacetate synthase ThiH [Syntrophales bacterium]HPO35268.1 2-iminoacetate synthase ThiH [Syntrophales bacterium]
MSFFKTLKSYEGNYNFEASFEEVEKAITKRVLDERDFLCLLSPAADAYLEEMARRAHQETLQYFGKTIRLYTPLYISDFCENACVYCGFSRHNPFTRKKLSLPEVEKEGEIISQQGFQDLLVLTGESRTFSPVSYIAHACKLLHRNFPALSVEIYPLNRDEYESLSRVGVNGLTLYQETYEEGLYAAVHPSGPKKDFLYRLEAPERGGEAGFRWINIGVLLGLGNWRRDVFLLGLHARYLMERFPHCDIGVGIPRLRPHLGSSLLPKRVTDRNLVQIICALRLFLPRLNISLTTRERPDLRDNLLPLGLTRLSAGSVTKVGGHGKKVSSKYRPPQFEILDHRSLKEIVEVIRAKGYEPVTHDWLDDDI